MKKNQERRLHRKNAKIVKEGGTPMQLSRPLKPDTTVSFGHNRQPRGLGTYVSAAETLWSLWSDGPYEYVIYFIHELYLVTRFLIETNRKCPRWAEFNSGTAPAPATPTSVTSPPPNSAGMSSLSGFNRASGALGFGAPVPSPLATSPPVSAMEDIDPAAPGTPSGSAPKIKLTLKRS